MSKKELEKIYEEYQNSLKKAPDEVRDAYRAMEDAIERYICAIEEWTFRTTFEFALDYAARIETKKAV